MNQNISSFRNLGSPVHTFAKLKFTHETCRVMLEFLMLHDRRPIHEEEELDLSFTVCYKFYSLSHPKSVFPLGIRIKRSQK